MEITKVGHAFRVKGKHTSVEIADKVTVSGEKPFVVPGPGEFDVQGVGVIGVAAGGSIVYRIEVDRVSVLAVGSISRALTAAEVDQLDGVDIVLAPGTKDVVPLVSELEPSIVIITGGDSKLIADTVVTQPKLSVTKDKLPEQMQVVALS